jgi:hypothetical protein
VGGALRRSRSLAALTLLSVGLWRNVTATVALLNCLAGHASLQKLELVSHYVVAAHPHATAAVGAALAALLAANAPALRELRVDCLCMREEGLGPLLDALPHNTHLTRLACSSRRFPAPHAADDEFMRAHVLPAVRGNGSLLSLKLHPSLHNQEVEALLLCNRAAAAARTTGAAAAAAAAAAAS